MCISPHVCCDHAGTRLSALPCTHLQGKGGEPLPEAPKKAGPDAWSGELDVYFTSLAPSETLLKDRLKAKHQAERDAAQEAEAAPAAAAESGEGVANVQGEGSRPATARSARSAGAGSSVGGEGTATEEGGDDAPAEELSAEEVAAQEAAAAAAAAAEADAALAAEAQTLLTAFEANAQVGRSGAMGGGGICELLAQWFRL